MGISCKDVLALPALSRLKTVAGLDGLDRVIRWVHVADLPQVADWVQGGELLFITGIGIKRDTESMLALLREIQAKNLAGLVINVGPYIPEVPVELMELADVLDFPVFELPWEVRLVDITEAICSAIVMKQMEEKSVRDLLENILFSEFISPELLITRALHYGYDLTKLSCQVAIIEVDDFSAFLREKGVNDENKIIEIKTRLQRTIQDVVARAYKKALSMQRGDAIILLLTAGDEKERREIASLVQEMNKAVERQFPGLTVSVGLGSWYAELGEHKKGLQEAEQALKVAKASAGKSRICSYQELGIYRVLFKVSDQEELRSFYNETLGPLVEYSSLYNISLLESLEVYLAENGNLAKAAERLYIHRNTLKYRLQKVEEISGKSLHDAHQRLNFQVGLMIGKFLNLSE